MTVKEASAARQLGNRVIGKLPEEDYGFRAEAQNSQAVNRTFSERDTFADPGTVAVVITSRQSPPLVAG